MNADTHLDDFNLLAAYVDDRLDEPERRLVTDHLLSCDACRTALAGIARERHEPSVAAVVDPAGTGPVPARARTIRQRIAWLPIAAGVVMATAIGIRSLMTRESAVGSRAADPVPQQSPNLPPAPAVSVPRDSTPVTQSPQPGTRAGDPSNVDPRVLLRRGTEQRIGDKTFRLVAGEWIDTAYDPLAGLPEVSGRTAEETSALVQRVPALERYGRLGARVLVVVEGTVYRLSGGGDQGR